MTHSFKPVPDKSDILARSLVKLHEHLGLAAINLLAAEACYVEGRMRQAIHHLGIVRTTSPKITVTIVDAQIALRATAPSVAASTTDMFEESE